MQNIQSNLIFHHTKIREIAQSISFALVVSDESSCFAIPYSELFDKALTLIKEVFPHGNNESQAYEPEHL